MFADESIKKKKKKKKTAGWLVLFFYLIFLEHIQSKGLIIFLYRFDDFCTLWENKIRFFLQKIYLGPKKNVAWRCCMIPKKKKNNILPEKRLFK